MIEFIAGAEFIAILVLCAFACSQRRLCAVLVHGLIRAERKNKSWKEHLEAVVFQGEGVTIEDARFTADMAERRIEAELADLR